MKPGYHLREIRKGHLGDISKIREELEELEDAHDQGVKVMELVELSDLLGAIDAFLFKHHKGMTKDQIIVEKTHLGYDLTIDGHEVGSYGERVVGNHRWVYGTGIADPRFTYAAYPSTRDRP